MPRRGAGPPSGPREHHGGDGPAAPQSGQLFLDDPAIPQGPPRAGAGLERPPSRAPPWAG